VARVRVLAQLDQRPSRIDVQDPTAFYDRQPADVDAGHVFERGPGIAEGDRDVHAVQQHVGRAEGGPAVVAVLAEGRGDGVRVIEELERSAATRSSGEPSTESC
jgi:hypothetical protein